MIQGQESSIVSVHIFVASSREIAIRLTKLHANQEVQLASFRRFCSPAGASHKVEVAATEASQAPAVNYVTLQYQPLDSEKS